MRPVQFYLSYHSVEATRWRTTLYIRHIWHKKLRLFNIMLIYHLLSFHLPWAMLVFSPIKVHDSREAPFDGILASLLLVWTTACILQDTGFNWGSDKPIILTRFVTFVLI